jgi:uncharacterized protein YfeS
MIRVMTGNHDRPAPAAAFTAHFTDPLYDDRGDELAPFGSDEGSDLLWTWEERRDGLDRSSTLATVLACHPEEVSRVFGPMEGIDGLDTAMAVRSAAFVLLRLVGHLSEDDRRLALEALDFEIGIIRRIDPDLADTPATLLTQRRDLTTWVDPA